MLSGGDRAVDEGDAWWRRRRGACWRGRHLGNLLGARWRGRRPGRRSRVLPGGERAVDEGDAWWRCPGQDVRRGSLVLM